MKDSPHIDALINSPIDQEAESLVIRFRRQPTTIFSSLMEQTNPLADGALVRHLEEAGKDKSWDSRHTYRLDRRPQNQGGDQLHIFKGNEKWAYRFNGVKSEPNKYSLPATNEVKNIVRTLFKLPPDAKIESTVISASSAQILVEVVF